MPDIFDMVGDATTTDKGTIYDYNASAGEAFGAGLERSFDTNPFALGVRAARTFSEDMGSLAGAVDRIDQKTAEAEVKSRGLDLKIPVGGITRYELDTLQYLKQREIRQNTVSARTHGVVGTAAGFAGGLAGSLTDPINVASNFIPFVSEYRYARWLAQAGESTLARAAVRVGAGAIEGAAGAAVVEPLVYAGATSEQLDYTSADSFLNVAFGGIMGGGLHAIGGAVYDARVSRALRGLDTGIQGNDALRAQVELRDAAVNAPEHVQREALQVATAALERDAPVDVSPVFERAEQEGGASRTGLTLEEFAASKSHNAWLNEPDLEVYVRKGQRTIEGRTLRTLEIPNVESASKGSGTFTAFLDRVDKLQGFDAVYVENVETDQFAQGLLKRGFKRDPRIGDAYPSFYRDMAVKEASPASDPMVMQRKREDLLSELERLEGQVSRETDAKKSAALLAKYKTLNAELLAIPDIDSIERAAFKARLAAEQAPQQSTPRDLAGLIEQSKADRTQAAFDRQFGDEGRAPAPKPEPKDHLARAKEDFDTANDIVDEFRKEGRLTAEDEAALKQIDEAVKGAELKAKAVEAAAACMVAL